MGNHKTNQVTEAWIRNKQRDHYNRTVEQVRKLVETAHGLASGLIWTHNDGSKFDLHTYDADDEMNIHIVNDGLEDVLQNLGYCGELTVLTDEEALAIPNRNPNDPDDSKVPAWNNDL